MDNKETVNVLKAFYFGGESMAQISKRTGVSRDEVREALRGAHECGLIKYSTRDYNETFVHKETKKLGEYLKAKGFIRENNRSVSNQKAYRPYRGHGK